MFRLAKEPLQRYESDHLLASNKRHISSTQVTVADASKQLLDTCNHLETTGGLSSKIPENPNQLAARQCDKAVLRVPTTSITEFPLATYPTRYIFSFVPTVTVRGSFLSIDISSQILLRRQAGHRTL